MADKDDLSGRTMGEFVLRERLDEGGFGTVYRCEQPTLGREAVIKVLHRRLRCHDVQLQRFLREAQLASRLDHPYAAHVYAFGTEEADGLLWIAMELVQGLTLKRWLGDHGPMPLDQLVPFFEYVAEVVQTAHERGIVHRDLKPSNIMVIERAGRLLPKLLDFGVAKLLDGELLPASTPNTVERLRALVVEHVPDEILNQFRAGAATVTGNSTSPSGGRSRLTPDGAPIGTPAYMAPEQWNSAVSVGPSADLFALAVVAFEALTGCRPFEGMSRADFIELHVHGKVPPLGNSFPPALDEMFQRALARRPEDRFRTALELAGALRTASGLDAGWADLPRIEASVRDAWLAGAPQPLAESVAMLGSARNAHQAHIATQELARNLLRYLLAVALATRAQAREGQDDPALLELVRALDRRELSTEERIRLLRLLVRPLISRRSAHPIPELVDLVTPGRGGADGLDPILALQGALDHAGAEDVVRSRLGRLMPELSELLRKTMFLLDYALVVLRNQAAERWAGVRRQRRQLATISGGELIEDHPTLLDPSGRVCADLWPLVQAVPPKDRAEPELFVFDGRGSDGALLIAAPPSLAHHDAIAWDWVATHVVAEVEAQARMRDQIRVAAHQWQRRARPNALLWRGEVLSDLERWMRHTAGAAPLGELEAAFAAASRGAGRRARWIRRSLVVLVTAAVLAGVQYRAVLQTRVARQQARMAQQLADLSVTQAEVEEGRQALLHDESAEAQLHLSEAYRRGDHSPGTAFMLARALQPRMAEQARFTAAAGRMWSAAFSPDGRQIVTTDDVCARVWNTRANRLLFTLPHGDTVYDARYSADGARIVTAGGDGTVRIWDATNGAVVHVLKREQQEGKPPRWYVVAMSPDSRFVAAIDLMGEAAHVWDAGMGASVADLRNDASEYPSLAFSAGGRWLATSGGDDVRVFDTRTWAQVLTVAEPRVRSLSFDPTGRLATGTARGDASIWDIPSGTRALHLREVGEPIDALAFSPDGTLVVTASRDGAEQVWDAASGVLHSQFNALHSKILSVEFDLTSKLVVAAGVSGTVIVADAARGMPVSVLEGPRAIIRTAHFDSTSRRIVGASWDGTAWVWDATPPYRRWSSPPISDDCGLVTSLEPDRQFVATGCRDRNTRVWDTAHDKLLAELPSVTPVEGDFASAFPAVNAAGDRAAIARGHTVEVYELPSSRLLRVVRHGAAVSAVAFAQAGRDLVSGATDGSLLVTRDGREPIALPPSSAGIDAARFLADGRVVAADVLRHLRVYDPDHSAVLAELEVSIRVRTLRASPDSRRLLTVPSYLGKAGPPLLWDVERYRLVAQLDGHVGQVYGARFIAGGREIITAGGDGAARLWDGATGQPRAVYRGGLRFLLDAVITLDGSMVVAGGGDGLLRFWDAASGRQLWKLQAHGSSVIGLHFEGDDLVTRGFAGDISRWRLPPPERVVETCNVATAAPQACAIVTR
jgi:WD40 repeat protein/serine/threonine protein kinase